MSLTSPVPGMPRVATAIAVAAWAIAALAVALVVVARPSADIGFWFFAVDVMVAIVYGTVAAVTLSRRRHPVPWILAVTAVGGGLASLSYGWTTLTLRYPDAPFFGRLTPYVEDAQLQNTAWVPGTLALFLVIPWLIRDRPLRWEWLGPVTGTGVIAVMVYERYAKEGAWDRTLFIVTVALGVLTAAAVELRRRTGPAEERNGLGWLALGTLVMALSFLPLTMPIGYDDELQVPTVALFGDTWNFLDVLSITPALHLAAQALFPAAILVAVLRGRMWGLDLAISRATLSALLALGLVGVYLLVSLVAQQVIPGDGFAHLVSAAAVAVAVQPARLVAEARVNRLVYGDAVADPAHLVRRFGNQLGEAGSADELFAGLARDLGTGMRLESVTIRPIGARAVPWGEPTSAPTVVPLLHRGEEVGTVEVTLPAGESLGPRGEQMIAEFGAVAATALAVLHQARQVDEARARLTRVRLEERRVIRREIHDGLGPSLAGLRLGLQGARNLLGRDDEAAGKILQQLQGELDQRVQDVRSLSHSLLPPVLDELGLGPALAELAARHRDTGLDVTSTATGIPAGLDPGLAATAYAIATEALSNAGRHSGATRCRLDAAVREDALVVEIADDGSGIGPDAVPGVGSSSMRERAEELGGILEVLDNQPSGTRVRAVLPLEVSRA
ncbi:sensor histidine kinase [Nocardioides marmoriginsengisoli]|uniref:histidine kinase n=1 Tax=Nocardioides marmoriginsengisoli TaxID=661483 RepID=A0A3N0CID1_9ACTN|nr:sensor histidine kinase [Nocardioides marmoriginsengisoli]RNL63238.1 sensor histidine kinase [Nocardioides marmoriginsengisoli]